MQHQGGTKKRGRKDRAEARRMSDEVVDEVARANRATVDELVLDMLPRVGGTVEVGSDNKDRGGDDGGKEKRHRKKCKRSLKLIKSQTFDNGTPSRSKTDDKMGSKLPDVNPLTRSLTFTGRVQVARKEHKMGKESPTKLMPKIRREKTIAGPDIAKALSVQDLRFKELEESLSQSTTPRDSYIMLSSANWEKDISVRKEDKEIIKRKFMPVAGRRLSEVKFDKMVALATGNFSLDNGEVVYNEVSQKREEGEDKKMVKFCLEGDELKLEC